MFQLSVEEINKLKSSPDYSPVFRIVINHSLEDLDDYLQQPNKFSGKLIHMYKYNVYLVLDLKIIHLCMCVCVHMIFILFSFFIYLVSQLPNTVQVALDGLQRQLEEAVQRQTTAIEDKIRAFTAEQYQLLEQFRERAHNEHRLLSKYDS